MYSTRGLLARINPSIGEACWLKSEAQVVDGDLLKVMSWYDNEWGYASQMVRQAVSMAQIVPVEPALSSG